MICTQMNIRGGNAAPRRETQRLSARPRTRQTAESESVFRPASPLLLSFRILSSRTSRSGTSSFHAPPSERELIILSILSGAVMWITALLLHRSSGLILDYGDNLAYLTVADAVRRWDFQQLTIQHFMGFPYFIAMVSMLFRVSSLFALWSIAAVSALVSVLLIARLLNPWAAGYFALTNFAWLQLSFLGGSEPLALALSLGALLAFRRDRIFLAAALGSLSVTVRPLMVFVLVGIGLTLLWRKELGSFFIALGTGLTIGVMYILPLARYFGDPLLTVHSYTTRDYGGGGVVGPHGQLFGWPFHGIVAGTLNYPAPWTNLLLSFFWIGLALAGIGMMFSERFRAYAKAHPNEVIFCSLYLLAVFSYDYLIWARAAFIRFSIPALPFIFYALLRFFPKDRRILWCLSVASAVLAALSAVGVRNVIGR
jgi:hypothetical protein